MPYLRHHESELIATSAVADAFKVPGTHSSIAQGGNQLWDIVPPQETASDASPGTFLTWQVPASSEMTDINQSFLRIEGTFEIDQNDPEPFIGRTQELPCSIFAFYNWTKFLRDNNLAPNTDLSGFPDDPVAGSMNEGSPAPPQIAGAKTKYGDPCDDVYVLALATTRQEGLSEVKIDGMLQLKGFTGQYQLSPDTDRNVRNSANNQIVRVIGTQLNTGSTNGNLQPGGPTFEIQDQNGYRYAQYFWVTGLPNVIDFIDDGEALYITPASLHLYNRNGTTTVPFLPSFLFNDLTIEVNGQQVVASQGTDQPYAMLANVIKNVSGTEKVAGNVDRAYYLGDTGRGQAGELEGNEGRRDAYLTTLADDRNPLDRKFTLTYRLSDAGFRTLGSWLPPSTEIRVRTKLNYDNFLTYDDNYGEGIFDHLSHPQFKLQRAELFVARKVLKPLAKRDFDETWQNMTCKVPFEQVRVFRQSYDAGQQTINIINALAGPSPKAVYVFAIADTDIQGKNLGANPTKLKIGENIDGAGKTVHWTDARLSIGGARIYPVQAYSGYDQGQIFDRNFNTSQVYQMYQSTCNSAPFLSSSDFSLIMTPLCFQLEEHHLGGMSQGEDTSIQFAANLSATQKDRFSILMVSFTDAICEISQQLVTTIS